MSNPKHVYVCTKHENIRSKPRTYYIRARSTDLQRLNELYTKARRQGLFRVEKRLSPERIAALIAEGVTIYNASELHPSYKQLHPVKYARKPRPRREVKSHWYASIDAYANGPGWYIATKSRIHELARPNSTPKKMPRKDRERIYTLNQEHKIIEL